MKKLIMLIICLLTCSCTLSVFDEVVIENDEPQIKSLTLTMVGDALVHTPIYKSAYSGGKYDFSSMFEPLRSSLTRSDLLYYNQESILGGESLGLSGYPLFNTPEEFGKNMIFLGFNIVSRANNHTLDKGEAGIFNSCNFWNKYPGVLTHGSACTKDEADHPRIMEANGIKYTMISFTMATNGLVSPNDYYVNIYSDAMALEYVERVRDDVDVLLVAMHWGDEYKSTPNAEQIRVSEYLASLGVDIIIGTHPHVIEPIRWIGDTLVIYSLGNFISNQSITKNYDRRIGLMVHVDLIKTTLDGRSSTILDNLRTELIYTHSYNKRYRVIPFSKLDDSILPSYKTLKTKYDSIIKYYDNNINTG